MKIIPLHFFNKHLTECTVGLFGDNCAEFCSPNCKKSGLCDKVTGQCEGGCQAGWTQSKCDASMYVRYLGNVGVTCNCFNGSRSESILATC